MRIFAFLLSGWLFASILACASSLRKAKYPRAMSISRKDEIFNIVVRLMIIVALSCVGRV